MIYHDHYTQYINLELLNEQEIISSAEKEALEKGFNGDYRLVIHTNADLEIIAAEFVNHITRSNRKYFDNCVSCTRYYERITTSD